MAENGFDKCAFYGVISQARFGGSTSRARLVLADVCNQAFGD